MSCTSISLPYSILDRCQSVVALSYGQDKILSFIRAIIKDVAWFLEEARDYDETHAKLISAERHLGHISCVLSVSRVPHKVNLIWQNIKKTRRGAYALHGHYPWHEGKSLLSAENEIRVGIINCGCRALYNILSIINLSILRPIDLLSNIFDLAEMSNKLGYGIKILSVFTLGVKSIVLITDIIANKERLRRAIELILISTLAILGCLYFAAVPIPPYIVIVIGSINALVGLYKAWRKVS